MAQRADEIVRPIILPDGLAIKIIEQAGLTHQTRLFIG
jgi:hypothetical protein